MRKIIIAAVTAGLLVAGVGGVALASDHHDVAVNAPVDVSHNNILKTVKVSDLVKDVL